MKKYNKGNTLLEAVITITFVGMIIVSFISLLFNVNKDIFKAEKEYQITTTLQTVYFDIVQNKTNYEDGTLVYLDERGNKQEIESNNYFKIRKESKNDFEFIYISLYLDNKLYPLLQNKEEICVKLYE